MATETVSHNHPLDDLENFLSQAQAMAYMTWGNSGGAFRNMSDDTQDNYLWALSDLLERATAALGQVLAEDRREKAAA